MQELTEAENAINRLIKTLDERKEACLTRTFTEVRNRFQEVFKELVPGGRGDMQKEGSGVKVLNSQKRQCLQSVKCLQTYSV